MFYFFLLVMVVEVLEFVIFLLLLKKNVFLILCFRFDVIGSLGVGKYFIVRKESIVVWVRFGYFIDLGKIIVKVVKLKV